MESEQELVRQARQGSQKAFSQLVRLHGSAVYSLCYRMTGDPVEAEDLAQETFLRLYRSLDRIRPDAPVRPWLRRIAANVCLDGLRRRKEAAVPLDDLQETGLELRSRRLEEQPEEAYLGRERGAEVQATLLRLPADYRVVLVLRFMEDLSYQEIAQALEVPVSTVETRLFRARKAMARLLGAAREEERREDPGELRLERGTSL